MFTLVLYAILSAACILFGFYCLQLSFQRRKREDIVYDNSAFYLMLVSGIVLSAFVLYLLFTGDTGMALVPAVVALICLLGILSWHNETVVFDKDGFTRRDFFLRTRRCRYSDILDCKDRSVRQGHNRRERLTVFYLEKGHFTLSHKATNYNKFAAFVRQHGRSGLDL